MTTPNPPKQSDPPPFESFDQHMDDTWVKQGKDYLLILTVGLPASGKSFTTQRVQRYLQWHGYSTHLFNLGQYRRLLLGGSTTEANFFSPQNVGGASARDTLCILALEHCYEYFTQDGGLVGILDATNTSIDRREMIRSIVSKWNIKDRVALLWLENRVDDVEISNRNILKTKLHSPDYKDYTNPDDIVADFRKRIEHYEKVYKSLTPNEIIQSPLSESYIQILNAGRSVMQYGISGYLPSRLYFFLLNISLESCPVYLMNSDEVTHSLREKWQIHVNNIKMYGRCQYLCQDEECFTCYGSKNVPHSSDNINHHTHHSNHQITTSVINSNSSHIHPISHVNKSSQQSTTLELVNGMMNTLLCDDPQQNIMLPAMTLSSPQPQHDIQTGLCNGHNDDTNGCQGSTNSFDCENNNTNNTSNATKPRLPPIANPTSQLPSELINQSLLTLYANENQNNSSYMNSAFEELTRNNIQQTQDRSPAASSTSLLSSNTGSMANFSLFSEQQGQTQVDIDQTKETKSTGLQHKQDNLVPLSLTNDTGNLVYHFNKLQYHQQADELLKDYQVQKNEQNTQMSRQNQPNSQKLQHRPDRFDTISPDIHSDNTPNNSSTTSISTNSVSVVKSVANSHVSSEPRPQTRCIFCEFLPQMSKNNKKQHKGTAYKTVKSEHLINVLTLGKVENNKTQTTSQNQKTINNDVSNTNNPTINTDNSTTNNTNTNNFPSKNTDGNKASIVTHNTPSSSTSMSSTSMSSSSSSSHRLHSQTSPFSLPASSLPDLTPLSLESSKSIISPSATEFFTVTRDETNERYKNGEISYQDYIILNHTKGFPLGWSDDGVQTSTGIQYANALIDYLIFESAIWNAPLKIWYAPIISSRTIGQYVHESLINLDVNEKIKWVEMEIIKGGRINGRNLNAVGNKNIDEKSLDCRNSNNFNNENNNTNNNNNNYPIYPILVQNYNNSNTIGINSTPSCTRTIVSNDITSSSNNTNNDNNNNTLQTSTQQQQHHHFDPMLIHHRNHNGPLSPSTLDITTTASVQPTPPRPTARLLPPLDTSTPTITVTHNLDNFDSNNNHNNYYTNNMNHNNSHNGNFPDKMNHNFVDTDVISTTLSNFVSHSSSISTNTPTARTLSHPSPARSLTPSQILNSQQKEAFIGDRPGNDNNSNDNTRNNNIELNYNEVISNNIGINYYETNNYYDNNNNNNLINDTILSNLPPLPLPQHLPTLISPLISNSIPVTKPTITAQSSSSSSLSQSSSLPTNTYQHQQIYSQLQPQRQLQQQNYSHHQQQQQQQQQRQEEFYSIPPNQLPNFSYLKSSQLINWRSLCPMSKGLLSGYTEEIMSYSHPKLLKEYLVNKLDFRWPRGESYKDQLDRTERLIIEILRAQNPILIIAPFSSLRCIVGYFFAVNPVFIPYIVLPRGAIFRNMATAYNNVYNAYGLIDLDETVDTNFKNINDNNNSSNIDNIDDAKSTSSTPLPTSFLLLQSSKLNVTNDDDNNITTTNKIQNSAQGVQNIQDSTTQSKPKSGDNNNTHCGIGGGSTSNNNDDDPNPMTSDAVPIYAVIPNNHVTVQQLVLTPSITPSHKTTCSSSSDNEINGNDNNNNGNNNDNNNPINLPTEHLRAHNMRKIFESLLQRKQCSCWSNDTRVPLNAIVFCSCNTSKYISTDENQQQQMLRGVTAKDLDTSSNIDKK